MEYQKLTAENIDIASDMISASLQKQKCSSRQATSSRIMMEEIMLKYRDRFGEDIDFACSVTKKLTISQINLYFDCGENYNPLFDKTEEEESNGVIQSYLSMMGLSPYWISGNGQNIISMNIKREKRISMLQSLLLSVVFALLVGFALLQLPGDAAHIVSEKALTPVFDTFMRMLSCVSGPMIFLSVAWGIYGIGDAVTLEIIGKKMIGRFLLGVLLCTALSCALLLPFFDITLSAGGNLDVSSLVNIILDIVPDNMVQPFADNNTLQIIFMAVIIGLAALLLGKKTIVFSQFIEHANYIVQLIMAFISGIIHIFIFLSILTMVLDDSITSISGIYMIIPMVIGCGLICMLLHFVLTCIQKKIPPAILLRKMMPTFIIALSTASSAAAFSANVEGCKKMGINDKIINFGIPLGQVVYAIGTSISFLVMGLCMADTFAVEITPQWLLTLLICTMVLAIATPPIPGGSLTCFTIFAAQLGLPDHAASLCVAMNILNDFLATSINLFCLQCNLIGLSGSLGMLDHDKLRVRN